MECNFSPNCKQECRTNCVEVLLNGGAERHAQHDENETLLDLAKVKTKKIVFCYLKMKV